MKKIALKLGLAEEATEDQIIVKIDGMLASEKNHLVLKKYVDDQASGLEAEAKEAYDSLKEKDPENALRVLKLSRKDETAAKAEPEEKPAEEKPAKVSDIIKQAMELARDKKKDDEPDKESFDYLQKNDPDKLVNLRRSDPAKFQKLVDEYAASKKTRKP